MTRKIILNLAMSIDGYIAEEDGSFDWICGDGYSTLDTKNKWDYEKFLKNVDIVVMGKKCYDQKFHEDFKDNIVYEATSGETEDYDNIHFIKDNIVDLVLEEQKKEGKDIFLFGGGKLLDSFIKADIIDEYIIGIIPTILGKGRPLFLNNNPKIDLHMQEYYIDNGIAILKYIKR